VLSSTVAVTGVTKEPTNPETKADAGLPEVGVEDELALELLGLGGSTEGGSAGVGKAAREDEGVAFDMACDCNAQGSERSGVRSWGRRD
jgi:hypothetical protein